MTNTTKAAFADLVDLSPPLLKAAMTAVTEVLAVAEGETVLIVTNPVREVATIAMATHEAVAAAGGRPVLVFQPLKTQLDFAEDEVYAAMQARPDVVVSLSAEKMGKDRLRIQDPLVEGNRRFDSLFHYLLYGEKCLRAFWSPGTTIDMFVRTVPINYRWLREDCAFVKAWLDAATDIRITNGLGTNLSIGLAGRAAFVDDGDFSKPGRGGNLPAGEAFISPALGTASGRIVFDGSVASHAGDIRIATPILVDVKDGFVIGISGGREATALEHTIQLGERRAVEMEAAGELPPDQGKRYARNARVLGELGLGLNPAARVTGNMLEDEKAIETCHIAIGSNYDDDAPSLIHLDGIISRPTIVDEGGAGFLLRDGRLIRP